MMKRHIRAEVQSPAPKGKSLEEQLAELRAAQAEVQDHLAKKDSTFRPKNDLRVTKAGAQ